MGAVLQYTAEERSCQTKVVTKTLTAWNHWGCYKSESNISLKKKAETVLEKVTKESGVTYSQIIGALVTFVRGWNRMCENPRHERNGVSDTAVREYVYEFVDKVLKAKGVTNIDYEHIRDLADEKQWKRRCA
jgi:hypothetical protein